MVGVEVADDDVDAGLDVNSLAKTWTGRCVRPDASSRAGILARDLDRDSEGVLRLDELVQVAAAAAAAVLGVAQAEQPATIAVQHHFAGVDEPDRDRAVDVVQDGAAVVPPVVRVQRRDGCRCRRCCSR